MRTTITTFIIVALAAFTVAKPIEAAPATSEVHPGFGSKRDAVDRGLLARTSDFPTTGTDHSVLVHPDSWDDLIEEAFQEWASDQDAFDTPEGLKDLLKRRAKDKLKQWAGTAKDAAKAGWKAGKEGGKDALKDVAKKALDAAKEKLVGGKGVEAAGGGEATSGASADAGDADAGETST